MSVNCNAAYHICVTERDTYCEYGIVSICSVHGSQAMECLTTDLDEILLLQNALNDSGAECIHFGCICEDFLGLALFPSGGYFQSTCVN